MRRSKGSTSKTDEFPDMFSERERETDRLKLSPSILTVWWVEAAHSTRETRAPVLGHHGCEHGGRADR